MIDTIFKTYSDHNILGIFRNDNNTVAIVFPNRQDLLLCDYADNGRIAEQSVIILDFRSIVEYIKYNRKAHIIEPILTKMEYDYKYINPFFIVYWNELLNAGNKTEMLKCAEKIFMYNVKMEAF